LIFNVLFKCEIGAVAAVEAAVEAWVGAGAGAGI